MPNVISDLKFLNDSNTMLIHYACNGLYDGFSPAPNISCIVVCNLSCKYKHKFYVKDYLVEHSLIESEKLLLKKFADFFNKNIDKYFVHWNMDNQNFGFNAIKTRCNELNIEIKNIPDKNKIDLSKIVARLATKKLSLKQTLMLNDILFENFLSGKEELEEYNKGNYNSILESVHDKVIGLSMLVNVINEESFNSSLRQNSNSKYSKEELIQIDKKLKEYRKEMFSHHNVFMSKMQQDLEDYKDELEDEIYKSLETSSEKENKGTMLIYDANHPILSMLISMFLNK